MKIEIVKFKNNTYGVRKTKRFLFWVFHEFLSRYSENWHPHFYVKDFCEFSTKEEAEEKLTTYLEALTIDFGTPVDKL